MENIKDTILDIYQIRKSNPEKTAFIEYLKNRLSRAGYTEEDITIEQKGKGLFLSRNIVVGNPGQADVILTAHYDTCAVLPFPNFMAPTHEGLFILSQLFITAIILFFAFAATILVELVTNGYFNAGDVFLVFLYVFFIYMLFGYRNKHTANDNTSGVITLTRILESLPKECRDKICVVYFDNEEKGLFGSSFFKKKHKKEVSDKLLLNFDCVGDGEHVVFLAKKKAEKEENYHRLMEVLEANAANYNVEFMQEQMRTMMFGSDQMNFDKGVGICALKKSPVGLYAARIHTPFDTKCRKENIEFLVNGVNEFIKM